MVTSWNICWENGVKSDLPYPILGMSRLMVGEIRHELRWAVCCMAVGGGRGSGMGGEGGDALRGISGIWGDCRQGRLKRGGDSRAARQIGKRG